MQMKTAINPATKPRRKGSKNTLFVGGIKQPRGGSSAKKGRTGYGDTWE